MMDFGPRLASLLTAVSLSLLLRQPAQAQQALGARFERADRGRGVLPIQGVVRLQIGTGRLRPVRGTRLLVRIIRDRSVWSESEITQLPSIFAWNTAMVPPGDYQLQLVSGETEMDEAIEDETAVHVRALSEAAVAVPIRPAERKETPPAPRRVVAEPSPKPPVETPAKSAAPLAKPASEVASRPASSPARTVAVAPPGPAPAAKRKPARPGPGFRLARNGKPVGLRGETVLSLEGIERLPPGVTPSIVVVRDGQPVWRDAGCAYPPYASTWKTTNLPDGRYTLRLVLLHLKQEKKEIVDEIEVQLANRGAAPAAPPVAPGASAVAAPRSVVAERPPAREKEKPKPAEAVLPVIVRTIPVREKRPLLVASRGATVRPAASVGAPNDQFQWVASVSSQAGDPHPRVAAAQWALETGWGSTLAAKNNCFGIKAAPSEPGSEKVSLETRNGKVVAEVSRFAEFGSPIECILARLSFLRKSRYAAYWSAKTDEEACLALQAGGYATDPEYALKLIRAMRRVP